MQTSSVALAYLAMRARALSLIVFLSTAGLVLSQTIDISSARAPNPAYRPILLGKGPNALINRIDTDELLKNGQKDALVMFTCLVRKNGQMAVAATYRGSPNSSLLEQELKKRLVDAIFVPGIYDHQPVDAVYYGTITFVVVQGKPRLRIFSNQEADELKKEADFVGPQPILGGSSKFDGVHSPTGDEAVQVSGVADVKIKIDEKGNAQSMSLIGEHPPLLGFGAAALDDLQGTKFIPAFRDGKPIACDITLPLYYPEPGF